jgi:hypothetical protein
MITEYPAEDWRNDQSEYEPLWAAAALDLVLSRTRRGVGERRLIDTALLRSAEARRVDADGNGLRQTYDRPGTLAPATRPGRSPARRAWSKRSWNWAAAASR